MLKVGKKSHNASDWTCSIRYKPSIRLGETWTSKRRYAKRASHRLLLNYIDGTYYKEIQACL